MSQMNNFQRIIQEKRSVIIAADFKSRDTLRALATEADSIPGISGFKLGIVQGLGGLLEATQIVKTISPRMKIIYDHQKAGNDIPAMGKEFARVLAEAGVDAAILFPFTGPATQKAWTSACIEAGLQVIVGGEMTHEEFLYKNGGYIADDAPRRIYTLGAEMGVRHFVVPGNKLDAVREYRALLEEKLGVGGFVLQSPGLITQGGDISECGEAAGEEFHGIIGSAIYAKPTLVEMRQAMISCTSALKL